MSISVIEKIKNAAKLDNIVFKKHALTRMLERNILSSDVRGILDSFIVIEEYSNDQPFPSFLILGYENDRPLHAVVSFDSEYNTIFVITLYEPSIELWENDFKTRRKML